MGLFAAFPLHSKLILNLVIALLTSAAALRAIAWNVQPPIDRANYNRNVASFSPDECWKFFRFRKEDLDNLFRLLQLPVHLRKC